MNSSIKIENLEVTYLTKKKKAEAVKNVNCTFDSGINVVIGASGSGKTTLLRAIAHSLEYNGTILLDGVNILEKTKKEANIAYLSQNFVLYPNLTIFENIAFPLKNLKMDEETIYERVYDLAHLFDLMPCLSRLPKHLSIGQQQRVAFARALIKIPSILLLDEPFSNADLKTKERFSSLLKKIVKKQNMLTIYATHDIKNALLTGDRFFEMEDGHIRGPISEKEFIEEFGKYME